MSFFFVCSRKRKIVYVVCFIKHHLLNVLRLPQMNGKKGACKNHLKLLYEHRTKKEL